jgi:hypothetical protein
MSLLHLQKIPVGKYLIKHHSQDTNTNNNSLTISKLCSPPPLLKLVRNQQCLKLMKIEMIDNKTITRKISGLWGCPPSVSKHKVFASILAGLPTAS